MFALYYQHPETGVLYPCVSTRHMDFHPTPDTAPSLLAQAKNVEKVLRDYQRNAIDYYLKETGYKTYLASWVAGGDFLLGAETIDHFRIVPMKVSPDFDGAYTYRK